MGGRPDPRELPLYELSEAARFVGVSPAALAEWMRPVSDGAKSALPLLHLTDPSSGRLSFANLAEAHILEATRKHNIDVSEVRAAIETVRQRGYGTPHPLLTREFNTWGKCEFVECLVSGIGDSRDVNRRRVRLSSLAADLDRYLDRIERDTNDDPYQLFPMRRNQNKYVALNINVAAGEPVIAGTGLRVRHLSNLIRGGESIGSVARRYKLSEHALIEALAFLA